MTSKEFNWAKKISLKEIAQFYEDRFRELASAMGFPKEYQFMSNQQDQVKLMKSRTKEGF